jgi:hypothetical protein
MNEFMTKLTELRKNVASAGTRAIALADTHGHDLEFIGMELLETALKFEEMLNMIKALQRGQHNVQQMEK